jgi:transposase
MEQETLKLFEELPEGGKTKPEVAVVTRETARVLMPNRNQIEFRASDLESLLADGHRARLVWAYVIRLNLDALYAQIKASEGTAGRSRIGPEILLTLWLFATLESVGSARQLARLCESHDAYRWICGGVQVNYHTLADFRVTYGDILDDILTTSVANLLEVGAVTLKRVAQDGMRVRASAGAGSFRRRPKLEECLEQAKQQVQALKQAVATDPAGDTRRERAAKERAARERQEKIERALARLPEMEETKRQQGKPIAEARASMTDADASVMKMADGGFRPAYNVQFASTTESLVIVGVEVVTSGSDMAQMVPMVEQIETRYDVAPTEYVVDGGYPAHGQIDTVSDKTTVYAPVPQAKTKTKDSDKDPPPRRDPYEPHPNDSKAVGEWRERMATDEAKIIYKDRAATAECVNAHARQRNMKQFGVRGLKKIRSVSLIFAIAHNLMRIVALAPQLLGLTSPVAAATSS